MTQRTPEEIAEAVLRDPAYHYQLPWGDPHASPKTLIAAALRSAVEAEREACANAAEVMVRASRHEEGKYADAGWVLVHKAAASSATVIAEAIRARGKA